VTLELTVLPSGAIGQVAIVESSSHALLDAAALATVQSLHADPFPAGLPVRQLRVRVPVVFELR
jgi:TonB family protein